MSARRRSAGGPAWRGILLALVLGVGMCGVGPGAAWASTDRTLGEATGRSVIPVSLVATPVWADVVARMARMKEARPCTANTYGACPLREFQAALFRMGAQPRIRQLASVHRLVNAVRYVSDGDNYGRDDYWATPRQFFYRGGDCEDYAIAKMWALLQLGFHPASMKVLVLRHAGRGIDHAVLQVELDGSTYILDNEKARIGGPVLLQGFETIYGVSFGG
ncbi:transglutaminase-like cysteine peptidase [Zavarzinia sp. CC-PAN008]|uniref:transglutaminase-like cysteine peptidase n=1 Tax=Zavarzinia sp. CC-PAN008 TaxID=3243332 RepID=UPI003F74A6C8